MMTQPLIARAWRSPWPLHRFASLAQASAALAARIVADLERAVTLRGEASVALPGGSSPQELLRLLGYRSLEWRHVHVTLTDERWFPPDHPRSNAGQLARLMLRQAPGARWFPLWRAGLDPAAAADALETDSTALPWPLDAVVLGMGEDGHVASLFPGDETAFAACGRRFAAVEGPDGEPRVTLTADSITSARAVYLLVAGRPKLDVLAGAAARGLPVARILEAAGDRVTVFAGEAP